ncbi:YebC/PmpR family DNA-binding transcriptional regulator, partial [Candidatus Microgenomates bacterium]|nr:YebC/PmpR family DNA-binding transcriptional regulator [Candidatus Microgenomates bacterium]
MAGHSKWTQIKRKKGVKDQEKGAIFTKLSKLISIAVSEGASVTDPERNIKLRLAIEKAKDANMPKETIDRAIQKGAGPDREALKEVLYEGFGPQGTGYIV